MWECVATDGLTKRVTGLYLYNRNLTGKLPPQLGGLSALEHLWLHNNRLSGEIPPALGQLVGAEGTPAWRKSFEPEAYPPSWKFCPALNIWSLSKNQLTGQLPAELSHLSSLREAVAVRQRSHGCDSR